jgi:hypothetical protein
MSKVTRFTCFFCGGAVATVLSACDVQVHDGTPDHYPANYDVGMYEIKATVAPDAMVTPGSIFVRGVSGKQRIELTANRAGTEWTGMYAIRCQSAFPLQLAAIWKLQGLTTKQKVVPDQPREIKLIEKEPAKEASIDTAVGTGKPPKGGWPAPKGGWPVCVKFRFATQNTQITGAHIEPVSQDPADINAAKAITVTSPLPVDIPCGAATEVDLASSVPSAHGNLVVDTTNVAYPHWTTKVDFEPKQQ